MAAVLPRSTNDLGLFYPDLRKYDPPPLTMGPTRNQSRPDPNGISQPTSVLATDFHPPVAPLFLSLSTPRSDPVTSSCHPQSPAIPNRGMIVVRDYTPSEGEDNTPITVNFELRSSSSASDDDVNFGHNMSLTSLKLRLVFGRTAVKTSVKHCPSPLRFGGSDHPGQRDCLPLRLVAIVPPHSEVRFPSHFCVPLTIQAMDATTKVVESFTFGTFTYWTPETIQPAATMNSYAFPDISAPLQNKRKREDDVGPEGFANKTRNSDSPPAVVSPKKAFSTPPSDDRRFKLVRTTNAPAESLVGSEAAVLEWVVEDGKYHPNSLDKKWTTQELAAGRRLIRFGRELTGNKLRVACEIIAQEEYDEEDIVISCVYRSETRNCWFTSVDVIYLLERLVGGPFSVEEKNRIRRNLEGFKPTTVSKSKGGFELFFQRIMDFPPPKPRNIEKDVKVFPSTVLCQALEKIISKYSVIPRNSDESTASQDSSPPQDALVLPSSMQSTRPNKAVRSRSASFQSPAVTDDTSFAEPLKLDPSQQSPHLVGDLPSTMQSEHATVLPEPNAMAFPVDQYYFPHAADLTFPESDNWRRRESIVSLGTMSSHTDEFFSEQGAHDSQVTPGPVHTNAFSNPFASDVNLGTMSLGGHVHANVLSTTPDLHENNSPVHGTRFENGFADDVFDSRRSSLASELLYPVSGTPPNNSQEAVAVAYAIGTTDQHNVPHDLMYAQFTANLHHHVSLEDINA